MKLNTIDQVYEDPQVLHRGMLQEVVHGRAGRIKLTGNPVKFSDTPTEMRLPPPSRGEHTKEILRELGYSDEDLARLRAEGVIC